MEILLKTCRPDAKVPVRSTAQSAGADLYAAMEQPVTVCPGGLVCIPTGLMAAFPAGTAGFVFARSGLGVRHGICLSNGVGVIDSDYRGEIQVGLCNVGSEPYTVSPGDRIAQLVVMPVAMAEFTLCDTLPQTLRGDGGFGSTGKN